MLRNPRRIAQFRAAAHCNFARDCDEVVFKNDRCHKSAHDRLLVAKIFQGCGKEINTLLNGFQQEYLATWHFVVSRGGA